jgi:hypothetical protein
MEAGEAVEYLLALMQNRMDFLKNTGAVHSRLIRCKYRYTASRADALGGVLGAGWTTA